MNENIGMFGGSRVGYIEHEVENWLRDRVRAASGRPVAATAPEPSHLSIITVAEACRRTGLSRMSLWRLEQANRFPERVRLVDAPGCIAHRAAS
jgi:predicted DNA-binding transcriptional regulator AlpA